MIDKHWRREILCSGKVWEMEEYFVYAQGVCRIRRAAELPTAAQYFPFSGPKHGRKSSGAQAQAIGSEFPKPNQPALYLVSISIQLPTVKATDAQYSGSSRTSSPLVVHQS